MVSTVTEGSFRIVAESKEDPVKFQVYQASGMEKLPDFTSLNSTYEGYITEFSHKLALTDDMPQEQVAVVFESTKLFKGSFVMLKKLYKYFEV